MNLLIIGNGFDLALGFPTRYSDFLYYADEVKKESVRQDLIAASLVYEKITKSKEYLSQGISGLESDNKFTVFYHLLNEAGVYDEFSYIAKRSLWLQYFLVRQKSMGDLWIDFEVEIKNVISSLFGNVESEEAVLMKAILVAAGKTTYNYEETLIEEYTSFVRLLEIYMSAFVDQLKGVRSEVIETINADYVMSFNYTNRPIEVSGVLGLINQTEDDVYYVHGKAECSNSESQTNIILGFNADDKDISEEHIPYVKFYQRLFKGPEYEYLAIQDILNAKNENNDCNIFIFGHSLSLEDGDILKELFLSTTVKSINIYCQNNKDVYRKYKNLSIMLGRNLLKKLIIERRFTFISIE